MREDYWVFFPVAKVIATCVCDTFQFQILALTSACVQKSTKKAKDMTEEMTGKPYETGDLSRELDKRVKDAAADFCGTDEYQLGDLSKEMDKRVKSRVSEYIGKDEYEFGDISKEIENRRREWVKGHLGEDAAKEYEFGDITKKALANLTGNDDYQVCTLQIVTTANFSYQN